MYKIGGRVSARRVPRLRPYGVVPTLCRIFGDHSDVMTCRMTGFAMLASSSPQEAMDLGAVAHLSAIKAAGMPSCTSSTASAPPTRCRRSRLWTMTTWPSLVDYDQLRGLPQERPEPGAPLHPGHDGRTRTCSSSARRAPTRTIAAIPGIVQHYMDEINKLTGRDYKLFNYYGAPDAEEVIVIDVLRCGDGRRTRWTI